MLLKILFSFNERPWIWGLFKIQSFHIQPLYSAMNSSWRWCASISIYFGMYRCECFDWSCAFLRHETAVLTIIRQRIDSCKLRFHACGDAEGPKIELKIHIQASTRTNTALKYSTTWNIFSQTHTQMKWLCCSVNRVTASGVNHWPTRKHGSLRLHVNLQVTHQALWVRIKL